MSRENEKVLTADQYVVAELLKVKEELEETKRNLNNVVSANTYLTIENVKLETNLREIRKFFKVEKGVSGAAYVESVDKNGRYCGFIVWEHDNDFQDMLKLFGLEKDYESIKQRDAKETTIEETGDPTPETQEDAIEKESV